MLNKLLNLFCPEYAFKVLNFIIKTIGQLLSYFQEYVKEESTYEAAIDAVIELLKHMKETNKAPAK